MKITQRWGSFNLTFNYELCKLVYDQVNCKVTSNVIYSNIGALCLQNGLNDTLLVASVTTSKSTLFNKINKLFVSIVEEWAGSRAVRRGEELVHNKETNTLFPDSQTRGLKPVARTTQVWRKKRKTVISIVKDANFQTEQHVPYKLTPFKFPGTVRFLLTTTPQVRWREAIFLIYAQLFLFLT